MRCDRVIKMSPMLELLYNRSVSLAEDVRQERDRFWTGVDHARPLSYGGKLIVRMEWRRSI
jgi:hypothetical protein